MAATVLLALGEGCWTLRYRFKAVTMRHATGRGAYINVRSQCPFLTRSTRRALLLWVSTWFAMLGQWLAASRRS
jgi:hypothetical protein